MTGNRNITNKYHPPLISNYTAMSDRDWLATSDEITRSLIKERTLTDRDIIMMTQNYSYYDTIYFNINELHTTYTALAGLN